MDVKFWTFVFILQFQLVFSKKEQNAVKNSHRPRSDDQRHTDIKGKRVKALEIHQNERDYLIPPLFPHEEVDADDEEVDPSYLDYDYETKVSNYKDSPDLATVRIDPNEPSVEIPRHTVQDNLPIFLVEPENTYVVKNKPATLKCRTANALKVFFKCNGVDAETSNSEFVDPQTGVRIIEGECKVTRENVEEYFGSDKYQCLCIAWTSQGQIKSQPATIELAYIKKHFSVAPQSQIVKQYSPVTFNCEPPPAAPFVHIFWLKNGAPIVLDDNVKITKEDNLFIQQATILDMANYTCVAENLAGKRLSEPALLTVFVNGGWSTWSAWTDCTCRDQAGTPLGRKRERSCTAPRPLNGGQPCVGSNIQRSPDCMNCELLDDSDELADESDISLGRWTQWSEWSRCDTDCLRTRRRKCLSNNACIGVDQQVAQCSRCVRTGKSNINEGASYWPLLIVLIIASITFIIVVILGIKYIKVKMNESSPFVKPPTGSNYIGSVIKRRLTNQPDLTIHEEFHTLDSKRTHTQYRMSTRHEHLYEVPQLANSYMAPLDQEVRTETYENGRNNACKENQSNKSDSSCFLSSPSSYENVSVKISQSIKNASFDSRFFSKHLETVTSKIVSSDGDWLNVKKCGVSLFIPDGVVDKGEVLFTVEVAGDDCKMPLLQEGETQLSPVIRCGPKNFHFYKSVVLSFPHYASMKNTSWLLSILQKPEDINTKDWRKVLTLGQETPGSPLFAQVDPSKVYLVSEFLGDFVLVGKSFSGLDAKLFKLALFISNRMDDMYYSLKIRVLHDTPCAFYDCFESEKRCGGSLLCDPKIIYFQQNCSNLCINLGDVGVGWKIHSGGNYQEVKYSHLWNMTVGSLYCEFVLQQTDSINCLEINMSIYQKEKQSHSINFNLKTNELDSYIGKRLSCSSVETVNVIENPFHYSSLSKKEDHLCKNYTFRSNISIDNNYRSNVLTKSDRVILCKLLDTLTAKGNDWRLLAEKLKICSYYYYFSNTCSPTENILNLWLCRNNDANMFVNLSRIFREMGRIDCATVVERRCFPN